MKKHVLAMVCLSAVVLVNCEIAVAKNQTKQTEGIDRTVLPIADPQPSPINELDVRNAKAPPRFQVKAPAGAPNVLLVLLDDLGFAGTSTFGGPVATPTFEQIAHAGCRRNRPGCADPLYRQDRQSHH